MDDYHLTNSIHWNLSLPLSLSYIFSSSAVVLQTNEWFGIYLYKTEWIYQTKSKLIKQTSKRKQKINKWTNKQASKQERMMLIHWSV